MYSCVFIWFCFVFASIAHCRIFVSLFWWLYYIILLYDIYHVYLMANIQYYIESGYNTKHCLYMYKTTYRCSCTSFQSLTLGWLALVQALGEYQEHPLLLSSPQAEMPEKHTGTVMMMKMSLTVSDLSSGSVFASVDEVKWKSSLQFSIFLTEEIFKFGYLFLFYQRFPFLMQTSGTVLQDLWGSSKHTCFVDILLLHLRSAQYKLK